jgi:pyocin large subunit-like protein
MTNDQRWETLKDILKRVAELANVLEPQEGMSMRFINYNYDGHFNNLRDTEEIGRIVDAMEPEGGTRLGNVLDEKIVQPMIVRKAIDGNFDQPVIVLIITDGEVSSTQSYLMRLHFNKKRASVRPP